MYLIGLTGNIAVGKTTVCNVLRGLGAHIIDADRLVHRLLAKGQPVYEQVVAAFGPVPRWGVSSLPMRGRCAGSRRLRIPPCAC